MVVGTPVLGWDGEEPKSHPMIALIMANAMATAVTTAAAQITPSMAADMPKVNGAKPIKRAAASIQSAPEPPRRRGAPRF